MFEDLIRRLIGRVLEMGDDATNVKKRKPNGLQEACARANQTTTSYSTMSIFDAQKRLGFRIDKVKAILVVRMLTEAKYEPGGNDISKIKEKVYGDIVQYLDTEGYPTRTSPSPTSVTWFMSSLV